MRKTLVRSILPALLLAALPVVSSAWVSIGVSVNIAPPPLPVYVQPPCPAPGYIWTPGYWAWDGDDEDYYWVPGTWVIAPAVGVLWTPGYWGWGDGVYIWHAGYWGPHVGFYGGINYGFGYTGVGFAGGYWRGGDFFYNRSVTNVNVTNITNVYNTTVVNNTNVNRVSFNGSHGIMARPTPPELAAEREHHIALTPVQREHQQMASGNQALRASVNAGKPAIAATMRPAMFAGRGVIAARAAGGPVHMTAQPQNARAAGVSGHPNVVRADRPLQAQHSQVANSGGMNAHPNTVRADRPPQAQHQQFAPAAGTYGPMRADRPVQQPQYQPMRSAPMHVDRPAMPQHYAERPAMPQHYAERPAVTQHYAERPSAPAPQQSARSWQPAAPHPAPAAPPHAENRGPAHPDPGRRF